MQMSKSAGTEWSFILHSESALAAWGAQLAGILKIGDVIALEGNLGSGKTTWPARSFAPSMGKPRSCRVRHSHSFRFMKERLAIWHCDLYRLKGPEDTFEIGLDEAYGEAVTLIEWPDRLGAALPARALHVRLENDDVEVENARQIFINAGDTWRQRLEELRCDDA